MARISYPNQYGLRYNMTHLIQWEWSTQCSLEICTDFNYLHAVNAKLPKVLVFTNILLVETQDSQNSAYKILRTYAYWSTSLQGQCI